MELKAVLAGAFASALTLAMSIDAASADMRIESDPGGEVSSYVEKFQEVRETGEHIVIDGPCLSACTLLTGIVPRDHVASLAARSWVSMPPLITTMLRARWCRRGKAAVT